MTAIEIDLQELRTSIRDVLDVEASSERVHRHYNADLPYDPVLAQTVAGLGWVGLAVPESQGGLGLDATARSVLYEELGRGPAPLPMLATLLVAEALAASGGSAWLDRLLSGKAFAGWALGSVSLAESEGLLSGTAPFILDGAGAEVILIPLSDTRGALIVAREQGVSVQPLATVDRTRTLASLRLDSATYQSVAIDRDALLRHGLLAVAADCIGGAGAILERTIEYLKTRNQFGKPIGSFQALKHRVSNHKLQLELARALLAEALLVSNGSGRGSAIAALAKATAADMYAALADDAVQLHGGIGFTWEQDCHLFLKRAKFNQHLFDEAATLFDEAAALLAEDA